jgi:thiamine-monophosphate kinase
VDLDGAVLRERFDTGALPLALGPQEALRQVLAGGEEHALVATFADEESVPLDDDEPWRVIGRVLAAGAEGSRVTVDGAVPDARGWDHFAG